MDFIDPILSVASQIYSLVETVKANRKRCRRVCERVRALEKLVRSIQKRKPGQTSAEVTTALRELSLTLESARELVRKYTLANWMERVLKSGSHGDEFSSLNERLNDAFQVLSGAPLPRCLSPGRRVQAIFKEEVDTMKRFESPNILRMFGICFFLNSGSQGSAEAYA